MIPDNLIKDISDKLEITQIPILADYIHKIYRMRQELCNHLNVRLLPMEVDSDRGVFNQIDVFYVELDAYKNPTHFYTPLGKIRIHRSNLAKTLRFPDGWVTSKVFEDKNLSELSIVKIEYVSLSDVEIPVTSTSSNIIPYRSYIELPYSVNEELSRHKFAAVKNQIKRSRNVWI